MTNVIKQDVGMGESLRKKLEFICSVYNTTCEIKKSSIRTIERTSERTRIAKLFAEKYELEKSLDINNLDLKKLFRPLHIYRKMIQYISEI